MNKRKLALFLGMLCGDGCLTIRTRKEGYKTYAVEFYNTNLNKVNSFQNLFQEVFNHKGNISEEIKKDKKSLYVFRKYSKEIFEEIINFGFPNGKKKFVLRIPKTILEGDREEKILFLKGVAITDGSIKKKGHIVFHMGSKLFLEDLSILIKEVFNLDKPVKEYLQKEKFLSYQLILNKKESQEMLGLQV